MKTWRRQKKYNRVSDLDMFKMHKTKTTILIGDGDFHSCVSDSKHLQV